MKNQDKTYGVQKLYPLYKRGRKASPMDLNTPKKYVDAVSQFFGDRIDLDPCSNANSLINASVKYQLPHHDGLTESWDYSTIYVMPPFGLDRERGTSIRDWFRMCALAHQKYHSEVLALVPVLQTRDTGRSIFSGRQTASASWQTRN